MRTAVLACLAACLACRVPLHAVDWMENYEAAKAQAAKDGKDLFLSFTGSDWCVFCAKLKADVYDQEPFEAVAKDFVLVDLDFPQTKELTPKLKEQNAKLAERFEINDTFPTIVLTDGQGRPYARGGYRNGDTVERFLALLKDLRARKTRRDELFAQAEKAEGALKARLLDQALAPLDEAKLLSGYDETVKQIIALDAENKEGLKSKYEARGRIEEINRTLRAGHLEEAQEKMEAFLKEVAPAGRLKQQAWFLKAIIIDQRHRKEMLAALQTALAADPESQQGQQIRQILEGLKGE